MNIFRFIIRQGRIFTLIVIILPIIAGTYAYQSLPKEGEPEIAVPHAIVVTAYPGASPSEIESLVTNPLEEALSDLKNVDEMRSSSAESVSVIVIDFVSGCGSGTFLATGPGKSDRCPEGAARRGGRFDSVGNQLQ